MNNGLFFQINFRSNTLSLYFFVGCTAGAAGLIKFTYVIASSGWGMEGRRDGQRGRGGEREEKLLMFDRVQ